MALLKRSYSVKTNALDQIKVSFEGETPAISTEFEVSYEDALHGLKVIAANQDKKRIYGGTAILLVCGAFAMPNLFSNSPLLAVLYIIGAIVLVAGALLGPKMASRKTAAEMASMGKGTLNLFPGGYQVVQQRVEYNVPFRVVDCYESERAYIFVMGRDHMMVFNKKYFGEKNLLVREVLIANMGAGRRFFTVDQKGKVINNMTNKGSVL